jgi:transposase-like protein
MHPQWTQAKFWTFIRSALRQAWNKYPPKYEALKDAEVGRKVNKDTGKLAKHYKCAKCGKDFPVKRVQVDHIIPVGTLKDWSHIEGFARRLFCHKKDLRVLCKECHKDYTNKNR